MFSSTFDMTTYFYRMYVCFTFNFVSLIYLFIYIIPKLWTFGSYTLCKFLFTLLFLSVCNFSLPSAICLLLSATSYCLILFAAVCIVLHRTTLLTSMLHFSFSVRRACFHSCQQTTSRLHLLDFILLFTRTLILN
mgnify:CR=1 FL=1